MIDRVLVGFDGSEQSRDALSLGNAIAGAEGADLDVACVYEPESVFDGGDRYVFPVDERNARAKQDAEMRRRFSEVEDELGGRRYQRRELWGSPARELTAITEGTDIDLVVVGSTHEGSLGRVLPGSVGERLLHGAESAVAVAPLGFAKKKDFGVGLIGVGYTGTEESKLALAWAESLARQLGSRLRLIAAFPPLTVGWLPAEAGSEDYRERVVGDLEETLSAASLGITDVGTECDVIERDPAEALAEQGRDLDLLVVGSRGYGPLRRVLLGGVSGQVIQHAPCPVIVVPRGAKETLSEPKRPSYVAVES
ncbi:MAG TPA: universal stress protein [Solirubrobacterales bacterium]|jgi:nucleotide-binding universal stress UspA family protein